MGKNTAIEWANHTFNPWIGCQKISPACDNCYAERVGKRLNVSWGAGHQRKRTRPANWNHPRAWDKEAADRGMRDRVFTASLADVFDNKIPIAWRLDLFDLIRTTPNLDWLLLTKRIGNVRGMLTDMYLHLRGGENDELSLWLETWLDNEPPTNVWLGATVVNQIEADRDVPQLLSTPAAIRFLSVEPILDEINLRRIHTKNPSGFAGTYDALNGDWRPGDLPLGAKGCAALDWVIAGGESGPEARPADPAWIRFLRDQCAECSVPFFFKQWGEWQPGRFGGDSESLGWVEAGEHLIDLDDMDIKAADGGDTADAWRKRHVHELNSSSRWCDPLTAWSGDCMVRIGKRTAGRSLDGRTWGEIPA